MLKSKKQGLDYTKTHKPPFCVMVGLRGATSLLNRYPSSFIEDIQRVFIELFCSNELVSSLHSFRWGAHIYYVPLMTSITPDQTEELVSMIEASICERFTISNAILKFNLVIGVHIDGHEHLETLNCAAAALTSHTFLNDNRCVYTPTISTTSPEAISVAIETNSLALYGQVIHSSHNHEPYAIEMLLRYHGSSIKDWLGPEDIINHAVVSGKIEDLTKWSIVECITWLLALRSNGSSLPISLNLSALQMSIDGLGEWLTHQLLDAGLKSSDLIIELTEEQEAFSNVKAMCFLDIMVKEGVVIALDDVGTGFNNIINLATDYFSIIKLDKCIALNITNFDIYPAYLSKTCELVNDFNLEIVLEGVQHNIDSFPIGKHIKYQGFAFCKAEPMDDVLKYIEKYNFATNAG